MQTRRGPSFSILHRLKISTTALLTILWLGSAGATEEAFDTNLNERVISVPSADGPSLKLEVTVFTPRGSGPFPLAVLNHGKEVGSAAEQTRYRSVFLSRYFLSRGYAVALPMMRGFAGSQGQLSYQRCGAESLGLAEAQDIQAVIDFMAHESYVDARRIVVSGQSFGGWNTLAFGTLHDSRVKALLNFAGGIKDPDCASWEARLIDAAGEYGSRTRTPSLWFYGENDSKFPVSLWQSMYDRYKSAGGQAELVDIGHFVEDSHNLLGNLEGLPIWIPKVDSFLMRMELPGAVQYADYLPPPYPRPSHFAAIEDIAAVPYLINDAARQLYRDFLKKPLPRVFVVGPGGLSSFSGGFDPLASALQDCEKRSTNCRPYAIDGEVVWVRPSPAPPRTDFAMLSDESAVPYVNDEGRHGYEKFLTLQKPKAFVVAADGAWSASSLGPDPLAAALNSCQQRHANCRFYAVDDNVVWERPRAELP